MNDIKQDSLLLLDDPKITKILNSDNSVDLLLRRLKQSILTCDELLKFIKKKLICEDEHYNQMRKIARHTRDLLKHDLKSLKQDSFIASFDSICGFDEKLYNVGSSYVKLLTQMYDQLVSLSSTVTKSRKSIKEESRRKEKECIDAIVALEKLRTKYNNLCNELERLKGTDPQKKTFTLKGSKTSSQQEEDVMRKIEISDLDYKTKVVTCKKLKDEMLKFHRPSNTKLLKNLILEIDTAISAQLQKYSTWNETLFMNSGVTISPLVSQKNLNDPKLKSSMRSILSSVDNEKDLYNFLTKSGNASLEVNRSLVPVEYHVHPSFGGMKKPKSAAFAGGASANLNSTSNVNSNSNLNSNSTNYNSSNSNSTVATPVPPITVSSPSSSSTLTSPLAMARDANSTPMSPNGNQSSPAHGASLFPSLDPSQRLVGPRPLSSISDSTDSAVLPPGTTINAKTFGVPISALLVSDDDLVPTIVSQCIETIEKYGLTLEGIYRTSLNLTKLKELRELIDSDPLNINKIDPLDKGSNVLDSDIYCVLSLLKLFFASLPEPLLSNELYVDLINAMKIQDDNERYITLHHIIYKLSDESYWTLRSLILHLSKVVSHSDQNKMSLKNLGIVWGPTLMMFKDNAEDLQYQSKVIEELIFNANNLYRDD